VDPLDQRLVRVRLDGKQLGAVCIEHELTVLAPRRLSREDVDLRGVALEIDADAIDGQVARVAFAVTSRRASRAPAGSPVVYSSVVAAGRRVLDLGNR
jgi:hypothetical protein